MTELLSTFAHVALHLLIVLFALYAVVLNGLRHHVRDEAARRRTQEKPVLVPAARDPQSVWFYREPIPTWRSRAIKSFDVQKP